MGYIKSGKDDGATVHCGGERLGKDGFFVQPTIFTGINPDMKIMREEIFGPVGAVIKFEDDEGLFAIILLSDLFLMRIAIAKILSRRLTTPFMALPHMFSARMLPRLLSQRTN